MSSQGAGKWSRATGRMGRGSWASSLALVAGGSGRAGLWEWNPEAGAGGAGGVGRKVHSGRGALPECRFPILQLCRYPVCDHPLPEHAGVQPGQREGHPLLSPSSPGQDPGGRLHPGAEEGQGPPTDVPSSRARGGEQGSPVLWTHRPRLPGKYGCEGVGGVHRLLPSFRPLQRPCQPSTWDTVATFAGSFKSPSSRLSQHLPQAPGRVPLGLPQPPCLLTGQPQAQQLASVGQLG